MIHFHLSSYPESTGAHYSVGISPPFDYTKNCPVVEKYGKRKASKLKSEGFVLVQLQDERADQVRCRLTPVKPETWPTNCADLRTRWR